VTAPAPDAWPLSAAATAVLRDPGMSGEAVLKLALGELVVRDVLRVAQVERRRFRRPRLTLLPGARPATDLPVPLPQLAEALLPHLSADGSEATKAVQKAVGERPHLTKQLGTDVREALSAQGLLTAERTRLLGVVPRTRWLRTPTGESWASVPSDLERDHSAAARSASLPAVGLVLALDTEVARALRSQDGATVSVIGNGDDDTMDAVLGDVGAGLDGAVDGGASGGGDGGGDGGGGD
jgi:hypothetical protein